MTKKAQDILDFWFGKPDDSYYLKPRQEWFIKNEQFDLEIKSKFLTIHLQATRGELDNWQENCDSILALIIILDQFSRNIFRNQPEAFANDDKALELAQKAIDLKFDQQLEPVQSWFIYLPFEHSENIVHQRYCLELFSTLKDDLYSQSAIEYAQLHFDIIEKFGRFPHRNQILGRESTLEELDFLTKPSSSF